MRTRRSSARAAGGAALGAAHRRYLVGETAISIAVNAAVSAAFAWGLFHDVTEVPLRGVQGIGVDLVPTVFMITLMLTLALTLVTRRRMRAGTLFGLHGGTGALPRPLAMLPGNVLLRALVLALALTAMLVPASIALLAVAGTESMPLGAFVGFKVLYGAALGAVVTPLVLLRALADAPRVT